MSEHNKTSNILRLATEADKQLAQAQQTLEKVPLISNAPDQTYDWTSDFGTVQTLLLELRKKIGDAYEGSRFDYPKQ